MLLPRVSSSDFVPVRVSLLKDRPAVDRQPAVEHQPAVTVGAHL